MRSGRVRRTILLLVMLISIALGCSHCPIVREPQPEGRLLGKNVIQVLEELGHPQDSEGCSVPGVDSSGELDYYEGKGLVYFFSQGRITHTLRVCLVGGLVVIEVNQYSQVRDGVTTTVTRETVDYRLLEMLGKHKRSSKELQI